ncbi:MAG: hypothetical protein HZC44_07885 [Geobacter sp.]|nr:hypothetical protein [Geobacter sp.]
METSKMVMLGYVLNGAIDSGKSIALGTVEDAISDGTIIDFINSELQEFHPFADFDKKEQSSLVESWQSLLNVADSRRKFLVSNSGLCLLVAYCFQLIADNERDKK